MRRLILLAATIAAFLVPAAVAVAKGKHHPHDAITVSTAAGAATFAVHLDAPLAPQFAYSLWVANVCADADGVTVSAEYHPVVWGDNTDPQPVDGTAGTFTTAGVSCTGFTWMFPDAWTPIDSVAYSP